jgi:hypothetical protein
VFHHLPFCLSPFSYQALFLHLQFSLMQQVMIQIRVKELANLAKELLQVILEQEN